MFFFPDHSSRIWVLYALPLTNDEIATVVAVWNEGGGLQVRDPGPPTPTPARSC
jgi:hypothetical protein